MWPEEDEGVRHWHKQQCQKRLEFEARRKDLCDNAWSRSFTAGTLWFLMIVAVLVCPSWAVAFVSLCAGAFTVIAADTWEQYRNMKP